MPPTQLSNRHAILTLNGRRITAFSDDEPPVELPEIELAKTTRGQDGSMYATGTAAKGGEVMVKLLPTSPDTKWLMRKHAQIQNGARITFKGSYGDSEIGYKVLLRGGVLVKAPAGISPGKNVEFTFDFEEVIPQFDAMRTSRAPVDN